MTAGSAEATHRVELACARLTNSTLEDDLRPEMRDHSQRMNRTQVDLTDDQHEQLNEVARRKGRSLHDLIHEAIDLFLDEVAPDPDAPTAEESEASAAEGAEARD
jgi:Spy/CpxP family protein refolding chaperone